MKIITWNVKSSNKKRMDTWNIILNEEPDLILLQELGITLPKEIEDKYEILKRNAIYKNGNPQRFSTAVLINKQKGKIINEIKLESDYEWINKELEFFKGNFIACKVQISNQEYNVVSVYSPAWPVDKKNYDEIDVSKIKLKDNKKIWATEILWAALKKMVKTNENWIVGGDYNISETFDRTWQKDHNIRFGLRSGGNREILDRMINLGFKECLREYNNRIVPTFKHPRGSKVHQMDHLWVSNRIYDKIVSAKVGENYILEKKISDHLPIITEFN